MAIEFTPVQSTQAIPIGAGSKLVRVKYRHIDFLGEEERRQTVCWCSDTKGYLP